MERISNALLGSFRYELERNNIAIYKEFELHGRYCFAVKDGFLCYFELDNLRRICPFGVSLLWADDELCLCITILKDS